MDTVYNDNSPKVEPKVPSPLRVVGLSVLIFLISLVVFLPSRYGNPFSTRGEAREAVVAFNMLEQENFILPRRNGASIPSKPPLFHWLAVATSHFTGELDEFSIRFPSALTGALCLSVFFVFIVFELGLSQSLVATLILGTSFEFFRSASVARVDMVFCLFQTIAILAGFRVLNSVPGSKLKRWWFLMIGVSLALAILSKGPAGLVLPWGIIGIALLWDRGLKRLPYFPIAASVLISVALAFIWYYQAYRIGGAEFLDVQVMRENVARVLGSKNYVTGHKSPFYVGPLLFLLGAAPWSFLFPFCGWVLWKLRKDIFSNSKSLERYASIWVAVFFIFILITASKRSVYLLPAYPALAILLARVFGQTTEVLAPFEKTRKLSSKLLSGFGVILVFAAGAVFSLNTFFGSRLPPEITLKTKDAEIVSRILHMFADLPPLYICFLGPGLLVVFSATRVTSLLLREAVLSLGVAIAALVFLGNQVLLPEVSAYQSPNRFMESVRHVVGPEAPFFVYKEDYYPAVFYMQRNILSTSDVPETEPGHPAFVLAEDDELNEAMSKFPNSRLLLTSEEPVAYGKGRLNLVEFTR